MPDNAGTSSQQLISWCPGCRQNAPWCPITPELAPNSSFPGALAAGKTCPFARQCRNWLPSFPGALGAGKTRPGARQRRNWTSRVRFLVPRVPAKRSLVPDNVGTGCRWSKYSQWLPRDLISHHPRAHNLHDSPPGAPISMVVSLWVCEKNRCTFCI